MTLYKALMSKKIELEARFAIGAILDMRFGDGTGEDLQVKLATDEILLLFKNYQKYTKKKGGLNMGVIVLFGGAAILFIILILANQ